MNPFVRQPHEYKREYDIWETYIHDSATYIARMENIPYDEAKQFVLSTTADSNGKPINDPGLGYLAKRTRGNRRVYRGTFTGFMDEVIKHDLIMAPTMTVYVPTKVKPSLLGKYILDNMALRKADKKKMFESKMNGNHVQENFWGVMQESRKIKNNSMSGAHASPSTCLYNKSSHSTLTSSCRCATSYGNANNEKFLLGNRHLWCPEVTIATLLTSVEYTRDMAETFASVMSKYNLYYPTVDDVMECIEYSTVNYWRNIPSINEIRAFVDTMSPIERAAYVYVGDMYHLNKHNKDFVHRFISEMRTPATTPHPDPASIMNKVDADIVALVSLLCSDIMASQVLKDVEKNNPEGYAVVANTAAKVFNMLDDYSDFITTIWRPDYLPASIYKFPSIYRKSVVTSDTDSSIFTNEYWVQELEGYRSFEKNGYNTGYVTTYLTSQIVKHYLAKLSANLGVEESMIHKLSMKNEYYFPVFSLTAAAKHYYALVSAREGNVYSEMEMEVKGVNLRSSNAPETVMKRLREFMMEIMQKVMKNEKYTAAELLNVIKEIEDNITESILSGKHEFLHHMEIKDADSYIDKEEAGAYQHHTLWQEVFAPKYGDAGDPPYKSCKISVTLKNKTLLNMWLDTIEDKDFKTRMENYLITADKTSISTFRFPKHILEQRGIPSEIRDIIAVRRIVVGIMKPFYMVLESLGIYMLNDKITRTISEELNL